MLAAQQQHNNSTVESEMERQRRDSTTSESSLEHLDLGRTPKKLGGNSGSTQTTSTPHELATVTSSRKRKIRHLQLNHHQQQQHHQQSDLLSDEDVAEAEAEAEEDEDEEDGDQVAALGSRNLGRHKQRRSGGAATQASIVMDYSSGDASSLRKKFRLNRSAASLSESGFVDASSTTGHSGYLGNSSSATNTTATSGIGASAVAPSQVGGAAINAASSSSGSSSGGSGGSSPQGQCLSSGESGIGAGDEHMKYLCPICEVVSATPHEFTNHIRCHNYANGDTENFTCRICSKVSHCGHSNCVHPLFFIRLDIDLRNIEISVQISNEDFQYCFEGMLVSSS